MIFSATWAVPGLDGSGRLVKGVTAGLGQSSRGGFTLIELLVVVAIISILAAIAVPNFIEAQTRAKIARILSDMRNLDTGLNAYYVDYSAFPARTMQTPRANYFMPWFPAQRKDMAPLTSPISYITTLPVDILDLSSARGTYLIDYFDNAHVNDRGEPDGPLGQWHRRGFLRSGFIPDKTDWFLLSVGPDGYVGVVTDPRTGVTLQGNYPPQPALFGSGFQFRFVYDPTNGTNSVGNIFRFAGSRDPARVLKS